MGPRKYADYDPRTQLHEPRGPARRRHHRPAPAVPGGGWPQKPGYAGGLGAGRKQKTRRSSLNHLGDLAAVWLYGNDRQIKQVSYRETEANQPSYVVTMRPLGYQTDQQ